jgi:hypothetical protein
VPVLDGSIVQRSFPWKCTPGSPGLSPSGRSGQRTAAFGARGLRVSAEPMIGARGAAHPARSPCEARNPGLAAPVRDQRRARPVRLGRGLADLTAGRKMLHAIGAVRFRGNAPKHSVVTRKPPDPVVRFLTSIAVPLVIIVEIRHSIPAGSAASSSPWCTLPLDRASASSNAHNLADLQAVRPGDHYR